jgi:hypothetical protein
MARALGKVLTSMMGTREGVVPSIQNFPPVDIEQVARDLKLDTRGEEAGRLERPHEGGNAEDLAELDVAAEIERRARKASEEYRTQHDLYDGRIRRALVSSDQRAEIEAAGQTVLADFRVKVIDDLNHLHTTRREVEGRESEFQAFRSANALVRLPSIVSPRERTVRQLVLAIVVSLEAILNGSFFAKGSEAGLIGGIAQALGLSLLNIGPAILYAFYGVRLVLHRRVSLRIIGAIATAVYVFWALSINLLIAHYRDLFVRHAGDVPVTDVWSRLATAPFVLDDASSWMLAALGTGLSLLAMIDATGMDDLYFGYGSVGRRRVDAISSYADQKARYLAGMAELRDAAISDMIKVIEVMRNSEYEMRLAVEGQARLLDNYRGYLDHLGDCYLRLVQRYREANLRTRSSPAPVRFHTRPERPPYLASPAPSTLSDMRNDARASVVDRMEHFVKAINVQFEKAVREYETIPVLTEASEEPNGTA